MIAADTETAVHYAPIPERQGVGAEGFRNEIYPAAKPVVLRGFVDNWPMVEAAKTSIDALMSSLRRFDRGREVTLLQGQSATTRRLFYTDDLRGMNFKQVKAHLATALDAMARSDVPLYLQSTPVSEVVPGFSDTNGLSFLASDIEARIWIGNALCVQTHFDLSQNIACVVGGRRRFTLFPPSQTPNLYIGPMENTPAGTPVSLVDPEQPNMARFPRFADAKAEGMSALLEPGDAIFIPYFWWHHVRSLDRFNVLVNYWWNEYDVMGSPMDAMLHAILTLRDLPPSMKHPWQVMFDAFVFGDDQASVAHLPVDARGGLGRFDLRTRAGLWQTLARNLGNFVQRMTSGPRP